MEPDDPKAKKRARPRRGIVVAGVVVWLAITVVMAVKYWIVPAVVRSEFAGRLPEYWAGTGEIGEVDFSFFGPLSLRDVTLTDADGRVWVDRADVTLHLQDWPSLHPTVFSAEFSVWKVTAHVDADGRCRPPWRKIPAELWREYLDLRSVAARVCHLAVARADGNEVRFGALGGSFEWDPATRRGTLFAPWQELVPLEDIEVDGFVLEPDRLAVDRLALRIRDGRAVLRFQSQMDANGVWTGQGRLAAMDLDLSHLGLPVSGLRKGTATGLLSVRLAGWDANGLTGTGRAFVDGADLRGVPAVVAAVGRAGLSDSKIVADADVEATFALTGSTFVSEAIRLQFPLAAVDVEPGGSLDVFTGRLDTTVVVLPFEKVRGLLKGIPLVGLMVDLTEQFTRLRIHGPWHDAAGLKVESAPASGVTNGTRRFLTDAARGTRRTGRGVLGTLGALLTPPDPNAPPTRPARGWDHGR